MGEISAKPAKKWICTHRESWPCGNAQRLRMNARTFGKTVMKLVARLRIEMERSTSTDGDRIRAITAPGVNRKIDAETEQAFIFSVSRGPEEIGRRLRQLEREWDFERLLETEAATVGLLGLVASLLAARPALLVIPGMAASMMMMHALIGPYPLLPVFRRAGFRTRDEIDQERYALKAVRGDFQDVLTDDQLQKAKAAWRAVHL
jgi:hypothetical protein